MIFCAPQTRLHKNCVVFAAPKTHGSGDTKSTVVIRAYLLNGRIVGAVEPSADVQKAHIRVSHASSYREQRTGVLYGETVRRAVHGV
jgi:hypothetical protein